MDNYLAFVLGSGILENPYVIPASVFFVIACLITIRACRILEKGQEKKRTLVFVHAVLTIISIVIAFHLIIKGSDEMKKESQPAEDKVEKTNNFMKQIEL